MRFSVALCTYEGARYLPEQLESLAGQERAPDEVVVFDDGSSDETVEILEGFRERAPFPVELHVNRENVGTTKNFQQAILACTGDAIALCDQDDVWLPSKLARAAEALDGSPDVGFTFSDAELIAEDGSPMGMRLWEAIRFTPELRRRVERHGLLPLLLKRKLVTGATMTFRSELRDVICPIPDAWRHDAWASLICAFASRCHMLSEPLVLYRIHPSQQVGIPALRGEKEPPGPGGRGDRKVPAVAPSGVPVDTPTWSPKRLREALHVGRTDYYRARHRLVAEQYERAAERFNSAAAQAGRTRPLDNPTAERVLSEMEDLARHHSIRGALPDRRLSRVPMILEEWRGGGYRRLSRGIFSAMKDFVY